MSAAQANLEEPATWKKYTKKLCRDCTGACCSLEVEVRASDLVRMELMSEFELAEDLRKIAKRLIKKGVVSRYHHRSELFTLVRMANGACLFLDSGTRRCTIYPKRPDTCRNHPRIGPRSGYCAYQSKE